MDKASKATRRRAQERIATLVYCRTCFVQLDANEVVTLRPLKDTAERTTIPLADRRVTMCQADAKEAIASGDYAEVNGDVVKPVKG